MSSDIINTITLVGRLTRDAERKEYSNSVKYTFTLAVQKRVKEAGEWKNKANFFDVEAWNIDSLKDLLVKGRLVEVNGELDSAEYMKDDRKIKRIFIRAKNIQSSNGFEKKAETPKTEAPQPEFDESDLPPF